MPNARELFYQNIAQTSPGPMDLEIESANGVWMKDVHGKKYLDFISGISVSNVGHCHPKVVEAIQKQSETYMHLMVYGEYIQTPQIKLAGKMVELLPDNLNNVYFVNSGSEANEGAMKLAKRYTGRKKIVYADNAYHGSTQGVLSIIGSDRYQKNFEPLLTDVFPITFNNESTLDVIDNQTALVVMENVQAEAGIYPANKSFLEAVRKKCDEVGALLLFDEVQTGFGRTGKWFGFEHYDVVPDIITFAKGMGGGMPIGAFVSSKEIMQCLTENPVLGHITTFGGHPVSCAASLACIEVIEEEGLLEQMPEKAKFLEKGFDHASIINQRQIGLMKAIEFEDSKTNFAVIKECIKNGVITDWFLFNDKSLRIGPPLNISEEELIWAVDQTNRAIRKVLG
jgi:acetylornithine/succinyldiaminopimelate/putrescine aminotransferase